MLSFRNVKFRSLVGTKPIRCVQYRHVHVPTKLGRQSRTPISYSSHRLSIHRVYTLRGRYQMLDLQRRFTTDTIPSHLRTAEDAIKENPLLNDANLYNNIADATLADLTAKFEELENLEIQDFDVKETHGVVELKLGSHGTYVINKQTPNRQLWLSSPVSGPKRYNWDMEAKEWRNTRDGHKLYELLSKEISQLLNTNFSLYDKNDDAY